ncbi:MAG: XRE family transcriptional regulator [Bacteroidia bacterium]
MKDIIGIRIKNLRKLHGLSLEDFAKRIGVSKQMVSKYEQGKSVPGSDVLLALAKQFNQKPDYFFRKPEVALGEINFRKKSSFGAKRVSALKEEIRIQIENYLYIENTCGISNTFVNPLGSLNIANVEDVRKAAFVLKERWHIGQDSIYNVIDVLESNHIKVIEVEDESSQFDGLATVIDGKYYIIVIAKNMPVERKRFTLMHELGHLLLPIASLEVRQQEAYCNAFASEMLLSMANIAAEFSARRHNISMVELIHVQEKYGISIPAIVYKLSEAEIIKQAQLKTFYIRQNTNRELKAEVEASRYSGEERSYRFENLVYRAVSEEQITMSKASALLQVDLSELKNMLSLNVF